MTTRYQTEHYEDVAELLHGAIEHAEREQRFVDVDLVYEFAALFAADRPPSSRCWTCGNSKEAEPTCTRPDGEHRFGGFDRAQFLTACGLEE